MTVRLLTVNLRNLVSANSVYKPTCTCLFEAIAFTKTSKMQMQIVLKSIYVVITIKFRNVFNR